MMPWNLHYDNAADMWRAGLVTEIGIKVFKARIIPKLHELYSAMVVAWLFLHNQPNFNGLKSLLEQFRPRVFRRNRLEDETCSTISMEPRRPGPHNFDRINGFGWLSSLQFWFIVFPGFVEGLLEVSFHSFQIPFQKCIQWIQKHTVQILSLKKVIEFYTNQSWTNIRLINSYF